MNRKTIIICVCVAVAALALSLFVAVRFSAPQSETGTDPVATIAEEEPSIGITDLLDTVKELKSELKSLLKDIKKEKLTDAKAKAASIHQKVTGIRKLVDDTTAKIKIPYLHDQMENIGNILAMAEYALTELADPAIDQLIAHPLSGLKAEDGINARLVCDYLDFAQSIMPELEEMMRQANALDLSLLDSDGTISGYLELANKLLEIYHEDPQILSTLKNMLGADGDRFYLLVAQNSAEIRASGGFPGSIGTIQIRDGIMEIGDFHNVYAVLHTFTPDEANVTTQENTLFHRGLQAPRDADFCPDFERVAPIWAMAYEAKTGPHVDGIISMTPVVIQKLLAATEAEVELSDGTVLNGENATKVLQHEIYIKYYGKDYVAGRGKTSDAMFAETAKAVLSKVMKNLSLGVIPEYLKIAREGFADRTILLWMEQEAEQNIVTMLDADGGLNSDPMKPEAGVYYNCRIPSKMGWYLATQATAGERTKNADGSYTYPVTVELTNVITQEDINKSGIWLLGKGNTAGTFRGSFYFFAPAGGSISDFVITDNHYIAKDVYNGLELGFIETLYISAGKTITVTYNITTAPGAEEELTFSMTPTLQEYH